ncbi:hypothetical protein ACFY1J_04820 [Streptomyces sp. NPDC001406]|uniref:effector-associated constant component EACC1 n=1 Tax=Streptomyces sp. NPDC001406 TaxID=3364572 RepID=UPI0036C72C4B
MGSIYTPVGETERSRRTGETMVAEMAIFVDTTTRGDELARALAALPDVRSELDDPVKSRFRGDRGSSIWSLVSVACGTGGAATVAVAAIRQWIDASVTKIRVKVGNTEVEIEGRNPEAGLIQVERLLQASASDGGQGE